MANPIKAALRYAKRVVLLPWHFTEHARAAAEHREQIQIQLATLAGQQAALADLVNTQTGVLATHFAKLVWEELPRSVGEQVRGSINEPAERIAAGVHGAIAGSTERISAEVRGEVHARLEEMAAEYRLRFAEIAAEQRAVTDRHAVCYDRLVEQLRAMADEVAALRTGVRRAA